MRPMITDFVKEKPVNTVNFMIQWMKLKGWNIRNNDCINKILENNEDLTLNNFSNLDKTDKDTEQLELRDNEEGERELDDSE